MANFAKPTSASWVGPKRWMKTMSTNISKQKREDLLNKIKEIRTFISAAPQDENTGNLLSYSFRMLCHFVQIIPLLSCFFCSLTFSWTM